METENFFFSENIYLNRTEDFAENELNTQWHAQETTLTSFAHNLANQKN